ncbi:MAG: hypothetical protein J4A00_03630 [Gammaproteobacteria bacterium]|nr:hypothetical protein [Gammaproteobacteria bacterium]
MNSLFLILKALVALLWAGAIGALVVGTPQQQTLAAIVLLVLTLGHILEGLTFRRVLQTDGRISPGDWVQVLLFGIVRVAEMHYRAQKNALG